MGVQVGKSFEVNRMRTRHESQIATLIFKQIQEMKTKEKICDSKILEMVEKSYQALKDQ